MTANVLPFPGAPAPNEDVVSLLCPPAARPPKPLPPPTPLPLARPPRELTPAEERLQSQILDAYFQGRRVAQGHAANGIQRDRRTVEDLLRYVGQPMWEITAEDFESWAGHLGLERHLASSSQRVMHCAVATFFDYGADSRLWQNEARRQFRGRIEHIVTRDNRVIHTTDANPARPRRYLDAAGFDRVFTVLDSIVEVAAIEAPRRLKTFQRDRAMFYTFYGYGLRLSEGRGLDVTSFSPNPDLPELGRFGVVEVRGKGSRGSGPRARTIPAILADLPPLLTWYLDEVRPQFRKAPDEAALWLSEQGRRLGRAAIATRYKLLIRSCGLDGKLFSPHGLRHMYVSHQAAANVPILFTSQSVGHGGTAITARYTHMGDDYSRNIAYNFVRRSLDTPESDA